MSFKKIATTTIIRNVLKDEDLVIMGLPERKMIIIKHVPKNHFDLKKEKTL